MNNYLQNERSAFRSIAFNTIRFLAFLFACSLWASSSAFCQVIGNAQGLSSVEIVNVDELALAVRSELEYDSFISIRVKWRDAFSFIFLGFSLGSFLMLVPLSGGYLTRVVRTIIGR